MPVGFPLGAMYQTKYVFKENSPDKKLIQNLFWEYIFMSKHNIYTESAQLINLYSF